jgi:hypothetical protein
VKAVGNVSGVEFPLDLPAALHDEGVVPIGVVRMASAEPLVDQQRFLQKARGENGHVQGGVLVAADRMVHPVKNEFALPFNGKAVEAPYPLSKVVGIRPNNRMRINGHLGSSKS